MQSEVEQQSPIPPKIERVSTVLWLTGWVSFAIQIGLVAASGLMLAFAISGRNFTQATRPISRIPLPGVRLDTARQAVTPVIGVGIFWATCGILVVLFGVYLAFRQTRYAKRLRHSNSTSHPSKSEVLKFLKLSTVVGLIGLAMMILGGGATLSILLAKSIAQPQGVAIYDPSRIIRSLDILVAMANMNGIAASFTGLVVSLGLFEWLQQ
jgi:Protein of unknown function (DUF3611)